MADRSNGPLVGRPRVLARRRRGVDRRPRPTPRIGARQRSDHRARGQRHDDPPRSRPLTQQGLLTKVHGGATLAGETPATTLEPGFLVKSSEQTAEKEAIAAAAAELVRPGTAIGLTAGTTTWHLAARLVDVADLVVITNSIRILETLLAHDRPHRNVMLIGGIRTPSDALVGPLAVQALEDLHLDQVFLGVHGMTERAGYTTPNLLEADTNRAFVEASQRLIVVPTTPSGTPSAWRASLRSNRRRRRHRRRARSRRRSSGYVPTSTR